jgi:hypothetical protein
MQQVRSNTRLSFGSAQPSKVAQFSVGDNIKRNRIEDIYAAHYERWESSGDPVIWQDA